MRLGNPKLAIDTRLEEDGKWVDMPSIWWQDEAHPMRALIRGAYSREHQALIRKLTKGLSREQLEERADTLSVQFAVDLLRGWENWIGTDGEQIRYSVENCRAILENQDNRRVLDWINRIANDLSTYDADTRERTEKNLSAS